MRDVVVVGAGPAGLMAARALALARPRRRRPRRARRRSAFRSTAPASSALEAFDELDIPRRYDPRHRRRARGSSPPTAASVVVDADASAPRSSIARGSIRRSPTRAARPAPSCAPARACDDIAVADDGVTVTVDGEPARSHARACVLACGANYRFNRAARPRRAARVRAERAARERVRRAAIRSKCISAAQVAPRRLRVGRAVPPRRPCRIARLGLMCDARARRASARSRRACGRASAGIDAASWPEPRLKILPLGPVAQDLRDAAARGRRRRRPGQADDRRRHLLQPDQRPARRRDARRGAARRRPRERACARYETRWRERLGAEIRIGLAFRVARRAPQRSRHRRAGRARPRRRHRPDAAPDRRLQLASPVGARAPAARAVPPDPALLALELTGLREIRGPRSTGPSDF